MSSNRYFALEATVGPKDEDLEELCEMLATSCQEHFSSGGKIAPDESVFAYQPKKKTKANAKKAGDPIPVGYFKRKPHKNGLYRFTLFF